MSFLVAGVLLWSVAHWFPALAPDKRQSLIDRLGSAKYRGSLPLKDVLSVTFAVVLFGIVIWLHPYVTGVSALPGL